MVAQRKLKNRPTIITRLLRPNTSAPIGSRLYLDVDTPFKESTPLIEKFDDDDQTPYEIMNRFEINEANNLIFDQNEYHVRAGGKDITTE